jgi:ABC-2 type transport system ATP-binding protein
MRAGRIVDQGSPAGLIARYGRQTMEEVFLDIARAGGDGTAGPAAADTGTEPSAKRVRA